jgi:hypothetical protein
MEIVVDTLILLVVLQTALRLSLWRSLWWPILYVAAVGIIVWLSTDYASGLSKPQITGWLHSTTVLQDVAVVCLIDTLLSRLRWYPGLLILPSALYVLCQLLFTLTGVGFQTIGLLLSVALALILFGLAKGLTWLLPQGNDRATLHFIITIMLCLTALLATQQTVMVYPAINQNIVMEYISKALFGIANILLIPDVLMLIFFFLRSLVLLATTSMQYANRRKDGYGRLYTKYRALLYEHEPSEAYADYLAAQMEAEAAKDVNLSRLLTKLGPVLGLIGTLISMSPALVGLSTGDISGMAYNMQVVFSATVVGLVISVVGLFTQQLKSRWHAQDISRLEYVANQFIEKHEKEA